MARVLYCRYGQQYSQGMSQVSQAVQQALKLLPAYDDTRAQGMSSAVQVVLPVTSTATAAVQGLLQSEIQAATFSLSATPRQPVTVAYTMRTSKHMQLYDSLNSNATAVFYVSSKLANKIRIGIMVTS